MIQFSLVNKDNGILTKRFEIRDGELLKDSTQCFLQTGSIETIDLEFSELPQFLDGLESSQAILHGISIHAPSKLVATSLLNKYPDAMTRTKKNFFWPEEGIIMFDYDPPDGTEPLSKLKLLGAIRGLHPELHSAAMVWRPSASSNIVGEDGTVHRGLKNQRVYVQYENPDSMGEFVENLEYAAWDKGFGHIFITAAGTALPRCIFDTAVFSPERLDFAAGAECGEGLKDQIIRSTYEPGNVVNFDNVGQKFDRKRCQLQIESMKKDMNVSITEARDKYKRAQAEKLASQQDITLAKAKKIVSARLKHKIMPKDVLYANDMTPIPVMDIILNQDEYHEMVIRDPLEPEYGAAKAKIFTDETAITINSFAHGGRVFRVLLDAECYIKLLDEIEDPEELLEIWTDRFGDFSGGQADKERIAKEVAKRTGVSKTTLMKDVRQKEKDDQVAAQEEREDDDLSHHQIAERVLANLPEHTVATEGSIYSYNGANCWGATGMVEVELMVARAYDCLPRCCRRSDYVQISKQMYNIKQDDEFFHMTDPVIATLDASWIFHKSTGEVEKTPHHPDHKVRFLLPFNSVPDDEYDIPPMAEVYYKQAFASDLTQIPFMQENFGCIQFGTLTRQWHKAMLLRGDGENGKSVTVDILLGLVPKAYVSSVSPFQFGDPLYVAQISGKMVNVMTEIEKGAKLPAAGFKAIIDTSDLITGKRLYQQPFKFPSTASHIFSSNHPVRTDDGSHGMKRRWNMFRYMHKVAPEDKIPYLGRIIAEKESAYLFNWGIRGIKRLHDQGEFSETESQKYLSKEMFIEADSISAFLADEDVVCTDTSVPNLKVLRAGLYKHYREWCRDNGRKYQEIISKARFNNKLEDMGFELVRSKGQFFWKGLKINSTAV